MEKVLKIEEITGLKLGHVWRPAERVSLGMAQMLNALCGCSEYDGYKITTTEHEYMILIDNGQSCCESWGYFSSDDDFEKFIGQNLHSVELTDTALNRKDWTKLNRMVSIGVASSLLISKWGMALFYSLPFITPTMDIMGTRLLLQRTRIFFCRTRCRKSTPGGEKAMEDILGEMYRSHSVLIKLAEDPAPIGEPGRAYVPPPPPKRLYSEKELLELFKAEREREERRWRRESVIDTHIDGLALMVREATEQRLQEICTTHPELLEQREDVVLWQQGTPGNPIETRYLITLNGEEIAKFSVCIESSGLSYKISVSDVEYCARK